jgi:tetratricopeptide (TPR) repeat protein
MCVWFLAGVGVVSAQNPVPNEDALAAESLLHSAANLYHTPTATARAGRLVAISRYLAELAPNDLRTQRLLADVYQSHGKLDAASEAARRLLNAFPDDYAAGVRWLRFRLNLIQVAPERAAMLQSVVDQANLPEALRSVAATEMARVLLGEGAHDDAVKAMDRALQLDPLNHTALLRRLELADKPAPADYVRTMLALLKGNPRAYWVARELAGQLADLGLHERALAYYRQVWKIVQGPQAPLRDAPADFACEYLSALLDADQPSVAVELFSPSLDRLKDSVEFVSLMIEALRGVGRNAQAEPLIRQVERFYRRQITASKMAADAQTQEDRKKQEARAAADQAVNLAWFYLLVDRQPPQARRYAAEARQWGAQGEAVDLLSGAADLAAGHPEGQKQLTGLVEKYPLAAAFLAKFEFDRNRPEPAKAFLLKGLQSKHRDLAYRMLLALAKENQVPLPPVPGAQEAGKLVDSFDPRVLEMGVEPGKFLRIDIQPAAESVSLCDPIVVEGKLTATGNLPIPVGDWSFASGGRRVRRSPPCRW